MTRQDAKAFPDTGPKEDGTRTKGQWLNAMAEDIGIIRSHILNVAHRSDEFDISKEIAIAIKESRRLTNDLYRFAREIFEIERDAIDEHRL